MAIPDEWFTRPWYKTEVEKLESEVEAYRRTGLTPAEVSELAEAKRAGRLVALPCKIFDIVYAISRGKIIERDVKSIEVYSRGCRLIFGSTIFAFSQDVGKTVFLTRAEADAALERQETK